MTLPPDAWRAIAELLTVASPFVAVRALRRELHLLRREFHGFRGGVRLDVASLDRRVLELEARPPAPSSLAA